MTRKDYIAELEKIRKQVIEIGLAFATVNLTEATSMERDHWEKTAKLVSDLLFHLYVDIEISALVAADKANSGKGGKKGGK